MSFAQIFSRLIFAVVVFCSFELPQAFAGDISWSGLYRIEYFQSQNMELDGVKRQNGYFLHHLILDPKFIAADGLTIHSRFDLFNNCDFGKYSQAGQMFGDGPDTSSCGGPAPTGTNQPAGRSNVFARSEAPETLAVNELYLTWAQEFGVFVAGRVPLQFGLGMTYNAGNGPFDHFLTNEDLVGYKIVMGNLFIMPMIGRFTQGSNLNSNQLDVEGGVDDYMIHLQYDNPETELSLGAFVQIRVATGFGDDTPSGPPNGLGGTGAVRRDSFKSQTISLFTKQKVNDLTVGVEAGLQTGTTGAVLTDQTTDVSINSYGIAVELNYAPPTSSWNHWLKFGAASGDAPGTNDIYEGFTFNRNYNVGMLMFNHPMGSANFFRTQLVRDTSVNASNNIDNEALSNAVYIAPSTTWKMRDNLIWGATLLYARLLVDPILVAGTTNPAGTAKDLGFETDFSLTYKPFERFTWLNEVGLVLPGAAWQGGSSNFNSSFAYGFSTKAAITF